MSVLKECLKGRKMDTFEQQAEIVKKREIIRFRGLLDKICMLLLV